MHVWVFIYTLVHTHILFKHKLLFWMRLIVAHPYYYTNKLTSFSLDMSEVIQEAADW